MGRQLTSTGKHVRSQNSHTQQYDLEEKTESEGISKLAVGKEVLLLLLILLLLLLLVIICKSKLSLCFIKHQAMDMYGGVEV
jgi:hypothetical protein